jgi:predicted nuclease of restriction endonuclease-like RecB superfamily
MEEIIDLIATDSSASDVSDKIKDVLFAKAADKIDSSKQSVATALFADTEATQEEE